ncbi:hypothetical protein [Bacteroides fragilis]|uniref:hypothetical protein n=1 Tax=Bacteroides fragilis TaxID=817 RepID=UPI0012D307BB|nr:hypothetical protein [Bacteroides fragilis]
MLKLSKMHLKSELFSEVKLKEGEMNFLKGGGAVRPSIPPLKTTQYVCPSDNTSVSRPVIP